MRDSIHALVVLLALFLLVAAYFLFNLPPRVIHQAVAVLLVVFILLVTAVRLPTIQLVRFENSKWVLFAISALMVQLFVMATGGLFSPFFFLIYVYIIASAFFLPFSVPLLFVLFSLSCFYLQSLRDEQMAFLIAEDPISIVLYGLIFFVVVPLSYALSSRYRLKLLSSRALTNQLKIEEAILSNIQELIIVADKTLRIVSLNDSVEQTLRVSRSEILQKPFFDVFFLKDKNGTLIDGEAVLGNTGKEVTEKTIEGLTMYTKAGHQKVNLRIKPINDLDAETEQISFILHATGSFSQADEGKILEEATTRRDALFEDMKNRVIKTQQHEIINRLIIFNKVDQDLLHVQDILQNTLTETKIPLDIAAFSKEAVKKEAEYASTFHVSTDFSFVNFGAEDIKPLLAGNAPISPDQLTGPFFSVLCDIKLIGILVQKLLDIAVLIAASERDKTVRLSVERKGEAGIIIHVTATSSILTKQDLKDVFTPSYGELGKKTHLQFGSGLEGFIAKSISDQFHIPLQVTLLEEPKRINFSITIPRGNTVSLSTLSTQAMGIQ